MNSKTKAGGRTLIPAAPRIPRSGDRRAAESNQRPAFPSPRANRPLFPPIQIANYEQRLKHSPNARGDQMGGSLSID
jgi:hypothetical protein